MKLISENLHIISKNTREAIVNKDENFIKNLISRQAATNPDWIDLNIGPARKGFEGTMKWLVALAQNITDIPLSFDSTNADEVESGLLLVKNPQNCIVNSTSADEERLETMTSLAGEFQSYLIALTLNNEIGIPKEADARLELAFTIADKCAEKDIDNEKILFDPLVLPISVDQSQAQQALDAIRMFKESFEPQVLTTIGLSNVSNGSPKELRPLINLVFFTLAYGCGLDSAIVDSFDSEIHRVNKVLQTSKFEKPSDKLLLSIFEIMQSFGDLSEVTYDKSNPEEVKIYKTAEILLNKKVYSHSYLEI